MSATSRRAMTQQIVRVIIEHSKPIEFKYRQFLPAWSCKAPTICKINKVIISRWIGSLTAVDVHSAVNTSWPFPVSTVISVHRDIRSASWSSASGSARMSSRRFLTGISSLASNDDRSRLDRPDRPHNLPFKKPIKYTSPCLLVSCIIVRGLAI